MNAQQLKTVIDAQIHKLATLTNEAARSDAIQRYLDTCAKFHRYSAGNQILITMSRPDASFVAGYITWRKLNRYVKKGEKGIPILAPCYYRQDPEDENSPQVLRGFKVVHVFDVSQTDGEPLPPAPDWKSPAKDAELQAKLVHYARSIGVQVCTKELQGETQGTSSGGQIELSPDAGTKTLIHEIAHELLHQNADRVILTRQEMEIEAEAVAYVVASHFSLPSLASPNYLALWDADSEKILSRMDRIRKTSAEIIQGLEPEFEYQE